MAEIFRAKTFGAAGFEKEFAIKLILPSLVHDKEFVDMFINEAKIAVSLYHANVVQVFDLGELENQYYIAMEYIHGMDLLDVLARCAGSDLKIPLDLVLFIMTEMLKGLDFAHRAKDSYGEDLNIIHRDVSPSNVLISYSGDVKLGDFGVAKAAIERTLTESGTLKGKVGYMSPEQVVGDTIDQRSDIYSAGIVFFEALSMNRLFVGNSDLDVMLKVRDSDIDDELEKMQPLPTQLEKIIRRALAKHREERYQSAGEFYQALMDFCFQNRIQTNNTHLSNFMRRLFAEEIEREKSQRMDADNSSDRLRAIIFEKEAKYNRHRESTISEVEHYPTESKPIGDSEGTEALERRYRFRDDSGLIYGPMGFKTIVALFTERTPKESDRISIDNGTWLDPFEVKEFSDSLSISSSGIDEASESNPLGKGILIRKPKSEFSSDSSSELGAGSSPVIESSASEPKRTETIEEAKESIQKMREQFESFAGHFSRVSFARLVSRLHRESSTGRLVIQKGEVEKSVYFSKGEPILVESNRNEELLGFFLRSKNVITQDQLEEGLTRLSEWGGRLGDALVAVGAIPAHQIFQYLSQQMREKILEVFTWSDGKYEYFEGQEPEVHGYPLGIDAYAVVAEGCFIFTPINLIKSFYAKRENVSMYKKDLGVSTEELRLSSKMLRIMKKIENGDTISVFLSKLGDEKEDYIYRVLYLLHQVEYLTFELTDSTSLKGMIK